MHFAAIGEEYPGQVVVKLATDYQERLRLVHHNMSVDSLRPHPQFGDVHRLSDTSQQQATWVHAIWHKYANAPGGYRDTDADSVLRTLLRFQKELASNLDGYLHEELQIFSRLPLAMYVVA